MTSGVLIYPQNLGVLISGGAEEMTEAPEVVHMNQLYIIDLQIWWSPSLAPAGGESTH